MIAQFAGRPVRIDTWPTGRFDTTAFSQGWPTGRVYGLDTETTPIEDRMNPGPGNERRGVWYPGFRVRTVQLAQPAGCGWRACVLRMDDADQEGAARRILADEATRFVSHSSYDVLSVWRHFDLDIARRNLDTEALAWMRDGSKQAAHGLKQLSRDLLDDESLAAAEAALVGYGAELARAGGATGPISDRLAKVTAFRVGDVGSEVFARYAALDSVAVLALVPVLVDESRATAHVLRMEQLASSEMAGCQLRGKRLDVLRTKQLHSEAVAAVSPTEAEIREITGLAPTQGLKLACWLVDHGVDRDSAEQTDAGGVSVSQTALTAMAHNPAHSLDPAASEVVRLMLLRADHIDDKTTTEQFLLHVGVDGRLHPHYRSHGAASGRATASEPNDMNLAQRKGDAQRQCFIPEPGWALFAIDYDQIELRIMAAESGEQHLIDAVAAGQDLHQLTADRMGISRSQAKVFNFQLPYGVGVSGLVKALGCSRQEAQAHLAAWRRANPRMAAYLTRLSQERGRVRMLSGRTAAPPSSHARANYHVQGSARDLMWAAWSRYRDLGGEGLLWAWLHDEFVATCPISRVDAEMSLLREAMTWQWRGMPITTEPVPLIGRDGRYRWMKADTAKAIAQEVRDVARRYVQPL